MKKMIFTLMILLIASVAFSEVIELKTYVNAPVSSFKSFILKEYDDGSGQPPCEEGKIYRSKSQGAFLHCKSGAWSAIGSSWAQTTDGSGNPVILPASNDPNLYIGIGTTDSLASGQSVPARKLHLREEGSILAIGSTASSAPLQASGVGSKFLWYPKKAAFAVGFDPDDELIDANLGFGSVSLGNDTRALADNAIAIGNNANATGSGVSIAIGSGAQASGIAAVGIGTSALSQGERSTAIGKDASAANNYSTAIGHKANANALYATAIGSENTSATGNYSTAIAKGSAQATHSVAIGEGAQAIGHYSTAVGEGTVAYAYASTAFGRYNYYNNAVENSTALNVNNPILYIGKGTSDANRDNALVFYPKGSLIIGDKTNTLNPTNTINYLIGTGNTVTSGNGRYAVGTNNTVGGAGGIGPMTFSGGVMNYAFGAENLSYNGQSPFAFGYGNESGAAQAYTFGRENHSYYYYSFALGYKAKAHGRFSVALGHGIDVSGQYSTGIALSDQTGTTLTQTETVAIMGGNVGIGVSNPNSKLTVDGLVRIQKRNTGVMVCNASYEGALHFDKSNQMLEGCRENPSSPGVYEWVQLSD